MNKYRVLFVCTGNICRSPTAEGIFRHHVLKAGLEKSFYIDSAGTHGYHVGDPPDRRAIDVAAGRGVAMNDLRARRLEDRDYEDFDLILAMDSGHYDIMKGRTPENSSARLSMFLEQDVPDPYYGGLSDFEHVFDLVDAGAKALLDNLKEEIGA